LSHFWGQVHCVLSFRDETWDHGLLILVSKAPQLHYQISVEEGHTDLAIRELAVVAGALEIAMLLESLDQLMKCVELLLFVGIGFE
jgi:hypothetical protein